MTDYADDILKPRSLGPFTVDQTHSTELDYTKITRPDINKGFRSVALGLENPQKDKDIVEVSISEDGYKGPTYQNTVDPADSTGKISDHKIAKNSRFYSRLKPLLKVAAGSITLSAAFWIASNTDNNNSPKPISPTSTTTPLQEVEIGCIKSEQPIKPLKKRTPSINGEERSHTLELIEAASEPKEIEDALNRLMTKWQIKININKGPQQIGLESIETDPSNLTLDTIKESAFKFLYAIGNTPSDLLGPADIYLTTNIIYNGKKEVGYYFYSGTVEERATILIDINPNVDPSVDTASITTDLVARDIVHRRTCQSPDKNGTVDKDFASLTPSTVVYGDGNKHNKFGIFTGPSTPSSIDEDKIQIVEQLLVYPGWFTENYLEEDPVRKKSKLILEELSSSSKEGARQLASNL